MDLFAGVVDTTLYRDDGWRFLQLGRLVERAQFTIALLLAHLEGVRANREAGDSEWASPALYPHSGLDKSASAV